MKHAMITRVLGIAAAALLAALGAQGATTTWQPLGGYTSSWNLDGNWLPATFPNAAGETAMLTRTLTNTVTIDLNVAITLGRLDLKFPGNTFYYLNFARST